MADSLMRSLWRTTGRRALPGMRAEEANPRSCIGRSSYWWCCPRWSRWGSCLPVPRLARTARIDFATPLPGTTPERYLAGGQTEPAIRALRRATAINRDNRPYRLALAGGLAADRQDDAARQVLLRVRESSPEDPEVNVRLARLEARHDDVTGTVRYYQNAVYGSWGGDQGDARRQVRIEMIRHLLAHQQRGRALSELLVLSGNLPDDVQSQTEAGQLFLEAGDPRRGLDRFRQALRIDPKNAAALAGAGEAAFDVGDYASAQRYLRAVEPASSHTLSCARSLTSC